MSNQPNWEQMARSLESRLMGVYARAGGLILMERNLGTFGNVNGVKINTNIFLPDTQKLQLNQILIEGRQIIVPYDKTRVSIYWDEIPGYRRYSVDIHTVSENEDRVWTLRETSNRESLLAAQEYIARVRPDQFHVETSDLSEQVQHAIAAGAIHGWFKYLAEMYRSSKELRPEALAKVIELFDETVANGQFRKLDDSEWETLFRP